MSDYSNGVSISLDTASSYWKILCYGLLFNMFIMRITNPLFKIVLATYVGIQTILTITYAPIVYHKQTSENKNTNNNGIIPKITSFIPNLMYKISTIGMKILLKVFTKNDKLSGLRIESCAAILTHCFIAFRKLFALACGILITREDDESAHTKALAIYTIFTLIQMKFITNTDSSATTTKNNTQKQPVAAVLKSIINLDIRSKKIDFASLREVRKYIFYLTIALVVSFIYYTSKNVAGSLDESSVWICLLKCVILVDSIFVNSFLVELRGLNMSFVKDTDTVV